MENNMYKLYYIWLVPAVFCLVYYVCCVAYAGFASSFITIWPVTAVFFAGIFAVRYAQNKGILILPMWINVLSAAGLLILISSFCLVQALITVQMKQKPEPDCEYLLILGCRDSKLQNHSATDLMRHWHIWNRMKNIAKIIPKTKRYVLSYRAVRDRERIYPKHRR